MARKNDLNRPLGPNLLHPAGLDELIARAAHNDDLRASLESCGAAVIEAAGVAFESGVLCTLDALVDAGLRLHRDWLESEVRHG